MKGVGKRNLRRLVKNQRRIYVEKLNNPNDQGLLEPCASSSVNVNARDSKIDEVIESTQVISISCLLVKKLTDSQAQRIFTRNQKFSMEWGLLNNLSWSHENSDYSIVTFGGFTFITAVLFISRLYDGVSKYALPEKLLLIFGSALFFFEGCLIYSSIEYVPTEIQTNALILGSLSLLEAVVLLLDVWFLGSGAATKTWNKATQTICETKF